MKLFTKVLLIILILANLLRISYAQTITYANIPVGNQTTKLSEIAPYYTKVFISQKEAQRLQKEYPIRQELAKVETRLREIDLKEQSDKFAQNSTPRDNTFVAPKLPPQMQKYKAFNSSKIDSALERSKKRQEKSEKQNLEEKRKELEKHLPNGTSYPTLIANLYRQNHINNSFVLYTQASSATGYKTLPEYNFPPVKIQALIAAEFKTINSHLQRGPAYKSYAALSKEIKDFKKAKITDMILMSVINYVILRNFTGVSIKAPAAAFTLKTIPSYLLYATKKVANFVATTFIYCAIDEGNLRAVNSSFTEIMVRFAVLEDNIALLKAILKSGEKNVFSGEIEDLSASSTWPDTTTHRTAMRRLYALRFINMYLTYSTASYKYDLAMLDLFNLFSYQDNVVFDLNIFEEWEIQGGKYVQVANSSNSIKIALSSSLLERTDKYGNPNRLIKNLSKLPTHIYYKKTYYKNICPGEAQPCPMRVNPSGIIRTDKGQLMDCNFDTGNIKVNRFSGEKNGNFMETIADGEYLMKFEGIAHIPAMFYRPAPGKEEYVFEDINTRAKSCESVSFGMYS